MRIDPKQHSWMTAPETLAVMAALGEARVIAGREPHFHAFTWQAHEIWGATAAIIVNLAQRLDGVDLSNAD